MKIRCSDLQGPGSLHPQKGRIECTDCRAFFGGDKFGTWGKRVPVLPTFIRVGQSVLTELSHFLEKSSVESGKAAILGLFFADKQKGLKNLHLAAHTIFINKSHEKPATPPELITET